MQLHSPLPARRRCLSSSSRSPSPVRSARFCAERAAGPWSPAEPFRAARRDKKAFVEGESVMSTGNFDVNELKRRMQGATQSLKHELGGLRTGRASASMLEPVQVEAYGSHMPLNQLATISVPE